MSNVVMLSLDLEKGVTEDQREKFNKGLADRKWIKIPKVTTTWKITFVASASTDAVKQTTKNHVAAAAQESGIQNYEAVMHIGPDLPTSFNNK